MLKNLQEIIRFVGKDGVEEEGFVSSHLPNLHSRRVHKNKKRTKRRFQIDVHIVGFKIKDIMLDLGSDVNILQRKT